MNRRQLPRKAMEVNPLMTFQTGYYALKIQGLTLSIPSFGAYPGTDYETELSRPPAAPLPPAQLTLTTEVDGVTYTCVAGVLRNSASNGLAIRIIEGGRYLNRIDDIGLIFSDNLGRPLVAKDSNGVLRTPRLEVASWPDRLILTLDFSNSSGIKVTKVTVQLAAGGQTLTSSGTLETSLVVEPQSATILAPLDPKSYVTKAMFGPTGIPVSYDTRLAAIRFDLPPTPKEPDTPTQPRLDELTFTVTNPGLTPVALPLVFQKVGNFSITGISAVLCTSNGTPTGIPIQLSKDWHANPSDSLIRQPWFRGCGMIHLAPGETASLLLRIAYGYWGNVGAVSDSQLSLIGYGGNSRWNQVALGSWGESITYDPDQVLGDAFIDDYRPSFVTGMATKGNSKPIQSWTANQGGAQCLVYYNQAGVYQYPKGVKVASLWPGPCLSKSEYFGYSQDDAIRFTYTTSMPRTNDMNRQFLSFKYEILKHIAPKRLALFEMAAEYYCCFPTRHIYWGSTSGNQATLSGNRQPQAGGNSYSGEDIPFPIGRWLSCEDDHGTQNCPADRFLILRAFSGTAGGVEFQPVLRTFGCRQSVSTSLFEICLPSEIKNLQAGDVISGTVEIGQAAQKPTDYWGSDAIYKNLLAKQTNVWSGAANEAALNNLTLIAYSGILQNAAPAYPIEMTADLSGKTTTETGAKVIADFTIKGGGAGYIPFILNGVPGGTICQLQRYDATVKQWTNDLSQQVHGNDFWQDYLDPKGSHDFVYNLYKNDASISDYWRYRVIATLTQNSSAEFRSVRPGSIRSIQETP